MQQECFCKTGSVMSKTEQIVVSCSAMLLLGIEKLLQGWVDANTRSLI
jgi:hypothetical protein